MSPTEEDEDANDPDYADELAQTGEVLPVSACQHGTKLHLAWPLHCCHNIAAKRPRSCSAQQDAENKQSEMGLLPLMGAAHITGPTAQRAVGIGTKYHECRFTGARLTPCKRMVIVIGPVLHAAATGASDIR